MITELITLNKPKTVHTEVNLTHEAYLFLDQIVPGSEQGPYMSALLLREQARLKRRQRARSTVDPRQLELFLKEG